MENETENENLKIYNQIKSVPDNAKKKIAGGRLKGMTDIKPMWRIEKLTEMFGVCGFGWKTNIKNKEIIEGANGEKIAIVDIDLYVKIGDKWSEAIEGTGGSSLISKEKSGENIRYYTSDECFKMAYTDALSVACKSLGMGADVYWGDSKYNDKPKKDNDKTPSVNDKPINRVTETEAKAAYALMIRKGCDVVKDLQHNFGISNTKDLTKQQYIMMLKSLNKLPDKKPQEELDSNDKRQYDGGRTSIKELLV